MSTNTSRKYRVVFDSNEIIAAGTSWLDPLFLINGPTSNDIVIARNTLITVSRHHTGLLCSKILAEYAEKLMDTGHSIDRIGRLFRDVLGTFVEINITTSAAPTPPNDPDDEIFILCAIDGEADFLISEDKHLLAVKNAYVKPIIGNRSDIAVHLAPTGSTATQQ